MKIREAIQNHILLKVKAAYHPKQLVPGFFHLVSLESDLYFPCFEEV